MGRSPARRAGPGAAWAVLLTLALALPGHAQAPPVDELVRLALAPKPAESYRMAADFAVLLSIRYGAGGLLTATARGALEEWHATGGPLHRAVTIREIRVPLVLRPFAGLVRRVIKERIENQPDDLPDVHAHDFFLLGGAPGARYVIGGVRRDIVAQAMARYLAPGSAPGDDTEARRAVARWLFTSPLMKPWVVRPGPPYALEAVVDGRGLLYALTLFYDWGAVHTQIAYAFIDGRPVWNQIRGDVASDLPALGRVTGRVAISLSNQRLEYAAADRGARSGSGRRAPPPERRDRRQRPGAEDSRRCPAGGRPPEDQLEPGPAEGDGRAHGRRRSAHDVDAPRRQPSGAWRPPRREAGDPRGTRLTAGPTPEAAPPAKATAGLPRRYGPPPGVAVTLSVQERTALERLCRAGAADRWLAARARAILLAAAGWGNASIATYLHRSRYWVQRWRRRFGAERLAGLWDRPRSGRPPRLSPPPAGPRSRMF
jgi:hypothetical protein